MKYTVEIKCDQPYRLLRGKRTEVRGVVVCEEYLALLRLCDGLFCSFSPITGETLNCRVVKTTYSDYLLFVDPCAPFEIKPIYQKHFSICGTTHLVTVCRERNRSLLTIENQRQSISYELPPIMRVKVLCDHSRVSALFAISYKYCDRDWLIIARYTTDYHTVFTADGAVNIEGKTITLKYDADDCKQRQLIQRMYLEKGELRLSPTSFCYGNAEESEDVGLSVLQAIALEDAAFLNGYLSDRLAEDIPALHRYLAGFRYARPTPQPNVYEIWNHTEGYTSSRIVRLEYHKGIVCNVILGS